MDLCEREPSGSYWRRPLGFILLHAAGLISPLHGQMDMSGHVMSVQTQVDPAQLPAPRKITGIGNQHLAISSKKPEAQMWFDQGLNLVEDYWDFESSRAFEQSVRVDPDCAICYWGLNEALSFYHENEMGYAPAALARAGALKDHANDRERRNIEASVAAQTDRRKAGELWCVFVFVFLVVLVVCLFFVVF